MWHSVEIPVQEWMACVFSVLVVSQCESCTSVDLINRQGLLAFQFKKLRMGAASLAILSRRSDPWPGRPWPAWPGLRWLAQAWRSSALATNKTWLRTTSSGACRFFWRGLVRGTCCSSSSSCELGAASTFMLNQSTVSHYFFLVLLTRLGTPPMHHWLQRAHAKPPLVFFNSHNFKLYLHFYNYLYIINIIKHSKVWS